MEDFLKAVENHGGASFMLGLGVLVALLIVCLTVDSIFSKYKRK